MNRLDGLWIDSSYTQCKENGEKNGFIPHGSPRVPEKLTDVEGLLQSSAQSLRNFKKTFIDPTVGKFTLNSRHHDLLDAHCKMSVL